MVGACINDRRQRLRDSYAGITTLDFAKELMNNILRRLNKRLT